MNKKNILLILLLLCLMVIVSVSTQKMLKDNFEKGKDVGWDMSVMNLMANCDNTTEYTQITESFNESCYYILTPETNSTCSIEVFC